MRDILFIACTRETKEQTRLFRSLEKLRIADFAFVEHNRRGLPAAYNPFLDRHAGSNSILVFAHDDVTVLDAFVREKLVGAADAFNVAGLVGSDYFSLDTPADRFQWPFWPRKHLSGAVEQDVPEGTFWSAFGPAPRRCVVLDGLFLAIDMARIGSVRFDERFDFHLYDFDFCLNAHAAGLTLGTANVAVNHASPGIYSTDAFRAALEALRQKWQGRLS